MCQLGHRTLALFLIVVALVSPVHGYAASGPTSYALEIPASEASSPFDAKLKLKPGFPKVDAESGEGLALVGACRTRVSADRVLAMVRLTHPRAKVVEVTRNVGSECPEIVMGGITDDLWMRQAAEPVEKQVLDPPVSQLKWAFYEVAGEHSSRKCNPSTYVVRVELEHKAVAERQYSGQCFPSAETRDGSLEETQYGLRGMVPLGGRMMPIIARWQPNPSDPMPHHGAFSFIGLGYHNGRITEDLVWEDKGWKDRGERLVEAQPQNPDGWKNFRLLSMGWPTGCESPRQKPCRKAIRYMEYTWNDSRTAYDEKELPVPSPEDLKRDADKFFYANKLRL